MLSHLKVIDLAQGLGDYTGRVLAELGADVLRVDAPATKTASSSSDLAWNNGKRRTVLDLHAGTGRSEFMALIGEADILIRNSASDPFDHASLSARNPRLIAELNERSKQNDPKAYAAAYRVLAETDLADRLPDIRLPTLVATGEDDIGSNTRMAKLMAERIPGARLHIFPGMRHSILTECPQDVARVMSGFLHGLAVA